MKLRRNKNKDSGNGTRQPVFGKPINTEEGREVSVSAQKKGRALKPLCLGEPTTQRLPS
jgi:hypothetical protein